MNFDITFGYPSWLILICLLVGLGYAILLYYKNKTGLSKRASIVLGVIRSVLIFIISLLVLSPMIERLVKTEEDPMILFIQDNTGSITFGPDSSYYHNEYIKEVQSFKDDLSNTFNLRSYTFGEDFKRTDTITFDEKVTDMSAIFDGLQTSYSNRNVGAVVIASDGIYNRGINPVYASAKNKFPVYSIALGDTIPHKDVILTDVLHNQITYKGNKFPLRINIEARECRGETSRLTIRKEDEELYSENITFESNHHFETVDLNLEADEAGVQNYHISMSPVEDEISIENNSKDVFIEVLDSRQQILILSNTPHPDVGAIKQSLEKNENYEVESYRIEEFDNSVEQYNLAIFHQLPSTTHPQPEVFQKLEDNNIPKLFIIGSQTNLQAFNNLQTGVTITPRSGSFNEAIAEFNNDFALFTISDDAKNLISSFPPLFSHFANYQTDGSARILFNQKLGNIVTGDPLILFTETGDSKTGVVSGEGIWRWRLHNFMREQNHHVFDELIAKKTQYLSILEDKSRLRIFSEYIYYENEPITFSAELYNPSYELINEPELKLTIFNEQGVEYPFVFSKTSNAYNLDAGNFPVGNYTYQSEVTLGDETFSYDGKFNVIPLNIEKIKTIANHRLLHRLTKENEGKLYFPGQLYELAEEIKQREDIKPVIYSQKRFEDAISFRGLFFLILILITIEWLVRRRTGIY